MKVLVAVKRVVDYNVKVRPKADGTDVDLANVKMSINPFCEIAVEEAVKMKENGVINEIVILSIGADTSQETIRTGLAMGGDRGIFIKTDGQDLDPLNIGKIIKVVFEKEKPDLIILGKQAIDDDCNQTGQVLATLLDCHQATFASKVEVNSDKSINVTREVDGGLETIKISLPCVITTDLRLNEPRYASLPNIMKAKQKKIETLDVNDLSIKLDKRVQTIEVNDPPSRKPGVMVNDVDSLIAKLKDEAKVI